MSPRRSRGFGKHATEGDAHALNHRQDDASDDSAPEDRARTTPRRQHSARQRARRDRVHRVLPLPVEDAQAVEEGEHGRPHCKVAAYHGCTLLDRGQAAVEAFALLNQEIILTLGEFLKPFMPCRMLPPMAPMEKPVPASSIILHGLQTLLEHTAGTKDLLNGPPNSFTNFCAPAPDSSMNTPGNGSMLKVRPRGFMFRLLSKP